MDRLTPAVQRRWEAGARRAISRRIHGVRLAITLWRGPSGASRSGVRGSASTPALPRAIPPRAVAIHRQESPGAGHADAARRCRGSRAGARADDQIDDGAGNEDFPGTGVAEDARRDVYRDAPDVRIQQVTLAAVDAGVDLDASVSASALGPGTADGLRRLVERGEIPVAGALDHRAAETLREVGR